MISAADQRDGPTVLGRWWHGLVDRWSSDRSCLDPLGWAWPGVSPALPVRGAADDLADRYAEALRGDRDHLGLIPAASGADVVSSIAWTGAGNQDNDTALFTAVLRDRRQWFGVRVVGLGFVTLYLSVAAPPTTTGEAMRVACRFVTGRQRARRDGRRVRTHRQTRGKDEV